MRSTFSGFLGAAFGWRSIYLPAPYLCCSLPLFCETCFPKACPRRASPTTSLHSLGRLLRRFPELREASLIGGLLFGSFSAFWATLVYRLVEPPFHYGARAAGLFGLVGAAGAAAAPVVGRMADRRGARTTVEFLSSSPPRRSLPSGYSAHLCGVGYRRYFDRTWVCTSRACLE